MPIATMVITKDGAQVSVLALRSGAGQQPIAPQAVVGQMDIDAAGKPLPPTFKRNKTFVELFTRFMRGELREQPAILRKGRVKPGEYLYVIDPRVGSGKGDVPFPEIVGWYTTDTVGAPVASTFEYNEEHFLMRPDGEVSGVLHEPSLERAATGAPGP